MSAMSYETVLTERRDRVGLVTLNRPDQRNAINDTMAWEIGAAVEELNDDPLIAAIVITGAGKAFSAGADFRRFENAIEHGGLQDGRAQHARRSGTPRDWIDVVRSSKPIVCA